MCNILSRIKDFIDFKGISVATFERSIGMSNASFGKQLKKNGAIGTDKLENILRTYPDLSPVWLLTGGGDMLINENPKNRPTNKVSQENNIKFDETDNSNKNSPLITGSYLHRTNTSIPLVSVQAVGGFVGKDFAIQENDIEGYYIIPKFRNLNVDFLIEVIGDSMMPRLFPGDIIACSILDNPKFIQWNKPYLIATRDDGLIVKRLRKSSERDCILAVSDNTEYDPFDIPKSEIAGLARVVGVIHVE